MTTTALVHAYQLLAAQAALDKSWVKTVETAITDHAVWLERHSHAGDSIMHQVEQRLKHQFDATTATAQPAQTADTTDAELRAHVRARDTTVTGRLDKPEAALQATLSALDVSLRAHTQDAVEAIQLVVEALAERFHLLETARGLTANSPSTNTPTGGHWREQDPLVGTFRVRIQEVETKAAEGDAKLYALEAELFKGLAQLSDKVDVKQSLLLVWALLAHKE